MADHYSVALAKVRAGRRANPVEALGKMRVLDLTTASIDAAQNDIIALCKLRKDWMVLFGRIFHPAFGASVTADVGIYAIDEDGQGIGAVVTIDKFLDGDDWASAGVIDIAETLAKGAMYVATADVFVCATLLGANPDAGAIEGYLVVVGD